MHKVEWTEEALQDLKGLDPIVVTRILKKLSWFSLHFEFMIPEILAGEFAGTYKLRVGDWRVRFELDRRNRIIVVLRVLHRSQAYRS